MKTIQEDLLDRGYTEVAKEGAAWNDDKVKHCQEQKHETKIATDTRYRRVLKCDQCKTFYVINRF